MVLGIPLMKTLILGLGNTILTDDGVGIYVSRLINKKLQTTNHKELQIAVTESSAGGLNFIDVLSGCDRAVIIDAIHTKDGRPGEFYELNPNCLQPSARISSLHGIDLATACDMARKIGIDFPKEIKIFVMEVEDEFSFGEKCTPAVESSIPKMSDAILKNLKEHGWI